MPFATTTAMQDPQSATTTPGDIGSTAAEKEPAVEDADDVELIQSSADSVSGRQVKMHQSGAQRVSGTNISMVGSGAQKVEAVKAEISNSGVWLLRGNEFVIDRSLIGVMAGKTINAHRVYSGVVIGRSIAGNVKAVLDARSAFALGAGVVVGLTFVLTVYSAIARVRRIF